MERTLSSPGAAGPRRSHEGKLSPRARPPPPHWPGAGGRTLDQWDGGSENAGLGLEERIFCSISFSILLVEHA